MSDFDRCFLTSWNNFHLITWWEFVLWFHCFVIGWKWFLVGVLMVGNGLLARIGSIFCGVFRRIREKSDFGYCCLWAVWTPKWVVRFALQRCIWNIKSWIFCLSECRYWCWIINEHENQIEVSGDLKILIPIQRSAF